MRILRLLVLLLLAGTSGCMAPYKKADAAERRPLKNQENDTTFQAFLGRLRTAVHRKDYPMLSSMMAPNFGYSWDADGPPSAQLFTFWDEKNLWPVLEELLREKFVPQDLYLVAPAQLTTDPTYNGPRCGMRVIGGSWKFAYFLPQGGPQ